MKESSKLTEEELLESKKSPKKSLSFLRFLEYIHKVVSIIDKIMGMFH